MITKLKTGVGKEINTEKYGKYFIEFGKKDFQKQFVEHLRKYGDENFVCDS